MLATDSMDLVLSEDKTEVLAGGIIVDVVVVVVGAVVAGVVSVVGVVLEGVVLGLLVGGVVGVEEAVCWLLTDATD